MAVRTAELVAAVVLVLVSVALMIKSAEHNIGWVKGAGPGAGAWPFWLSTGMLLTSLWTILRWFRKVTPESRNDEPFISWDSRKVVAPALIGLIALLIGTQIIGIYFSVMLFMLFFVRLLGRHGWPTTIGLMIGAPVGLFMFFEWALKVSLPKGYSEPLFYPIYDLMY
jgi:hypothetical protein